MDNQFTVTFGQLPSSYINREHIADKIYNELDQYLSIYVYDKIWSKLPENEKLYLKLLKDDKTSTSELINKVPYDEKSCSVYRDRLIKRGLIVGLEQGKIMLTLPRFEIFISNQE